jgi:putative addiction module antidote
MNEVVKIVKIGNSAGMILPKRDLERLQVGVGGTVLKVETPNGFELRRHDGDFEEQMAAAREVMARRKRALRELAK